MVSIIVDNHLLSLDSCKRVEFVTDLKMSQSLVSPEEIACKCTERRMLMRLIL